MDEQKKPGLYGDERSCYLCGNPEVVRHHIYGGHGRRPTAEVEGCWVNLCPRHHNMSDKGVHFDKELDAFFKRDCQMRWERREGISDPEHEAFRSLFHISYLDGEEVDEEPEPDMRWLRLCLKRKPMDEIKF